MGVEGEEGVLAVRTGWAASQSDKSARNIAAWPRWLRREAGITDAMVNTTYMREAAQALLDEADAIDVERKQ